MHNAPWLKHSDWELREAAANQVVISMSGLEKVPGWTVLVEEIDAQVTARLKELAASNRNDERNRGFIEAMSLVKDLPRQYIKAAQAAVNNNMESM